MIRQYRKIIRSSEDRIDWEVDNSKIRPKGCSVENSFFIYINFHPGVFKIVTNVISKFLSNEYAIILKSGKTDRYGVAATKNIAYYKFKGDDMEIDLMINFYPTNSAIDIRFKGKNSDGLVKFHDKGSKTVTFFFVSDVIPNLISYIYRNFDVKKCKKYWSDLAKKGLLFEVQGDKK